MEPQVKALILRKPPSPRHYVALNDFIVHQHINYVARLHLAKFATAFSSSYCSWKKLQTRRRVDPNAFRRKQDQGMFKERDFCPIAIAAKVDCILQDPAHPGRPRRAV